MLCHCALVVAAVCNFLLKWIGSAVSLFSDDGNNAVVLCPPSTLSKSLALVQPFWYRPPGRVNPLASAHLRAEGGEDMATTSRNTCSFGMSQCCTLPGVIWGTLRKSLAWGQRKFYKGYWHDIKAKVTKVRVQGSNNGRKSVLLLGWQPITKVEGCLRSVSDKMSEPQHLWLTDKTSHPGALVLLLTQ